MLVTWKRFCSRRRMSLNDVVQGRGLDYEKLCAFFQSNRATIPGRLEPEVVAIFGFPEPEKVKKDPASTVKQSAPTLPPKKEKKIKVSTKNTKAELLDLCAKLKIDASAKLTKAKILDALALSPKILVDNSSSGTRKVLKKKK